jgi:hypothetical protein
MAQFGPFIDAYVALGGTDVSINVKSVSLKTKRDVKDRSTMGTLWRKKAVVAGEWDFSMEFADELGTGLIDDIIWNAHVGSGELAIVMRPKKTDPVTAANKEFSGTVVVPEYNLGGKWGDDLSKTITFQGTGELTVTP